MLRSPLMPGLVAARANSLLPSEYPSRDRRSSPRSTSFRHSRCTVVVARAGLLDPFHEREGPFPGPRRPRGSPGSAGPPVRGSRRPGPRGRRPRTPRVREPEPRHSTSIETACPVRTRRITDLPHLARRQGRRFAEQTAEPTRSTMRPWRSVIKIGPQIARAQAQPSARRVRCPSKPEREDDSSPGGVVSNSFPPAQE